MVWVPRSTLIRPWYDGDGTYSPITAKRLNDMDGGLCAYALPGGLDVVISSGRISMLGLLQGVSETVITLPDNTTTHIWFGPNYSKSPATCGLETGTDWPENYHYPIARAVTSGGVITQLVDQRPLHNGDLVLVDFDHWAGAVAGQKYRAMGVVGSMVGWCLSADTPPAGGPLVVDVEYWSGAAWTTLFGDPADIPTLPDGDDVAFFLLDTWAGGQPSFPGPGRLRANPTTISGAPADAQLSTIWRL